MQRMTFADSSIDVIVHADTVEHVPDSKAALKESMRVLKPGVNRDDCLVQTEYGADFWCELFEAGFREVSLPSLIFPPSVAIHATK
jgi:ubiquinone/menaquinone biosynthesis C-methylase UbiE